MSEQHQCRNLIIILGDQLTLNNAALDGIDFNQDKILMVEAFAESTKVWTHKARIALFLSAMRHFAQLLKEKDFPLIYLQLGQHPFNDLVSAWKSYITLLQPQKIIICEPGCYHIQQALEQCAKEADIPLAIRDDTHFMCSRAQFKDWAGKNKTLRLEFFYRWMRKQHQVLMTDGQPEGGEWNYDQDNRKAFGKQGPINIPNAPTISTDAITVEVMADIEQYFPQHPGSLKNFCWPVTRENALELLNDFLEHKLAYFGPHQDAMWQSTLSESSPFLWHSLIASSLNLKLIHPQEVIHATLKAYQQHQLPLASVEGFIRQIIGWREFIHGVYWLDMPALAESNYFAHENNLPNWYWTGKTQMNCLRQTIQQTLDYGYAHHIQRLMVTGLFGLLAQVQPRQLEQWYLAIYVDAVEWVELPNTLGMALYANGGRFTSKPYVASGAYINRMSNYCQSCKYKPDIKTGEQACPFTTLYWQFLIKHYDAFSRNPRTSLMTKNVDRFSVEEKQAIEQHATTMLANLESL